MPNTRTFQDSFVSLSRRNLLHFAGSLPGEVPEGLVCPEPFDGALAIAKQECKWMLVIPAGKRTQERYDS